MFCAIFRRVPGKGMQVADGWLRSIEVRTSIRMGALVYTAFDPNLGRAMILPVGENADAVAAREDIVQVMFKLREREVFIHHLSHLKGRLHIERDLGDNTEGSKSDDGAKEIGT